MTLEFLQPDLDDNMSRTIDPKKNDEIKGAYRTYGVVQVENGRFACVQLLIEGDKVRKINAFGHLELEKEFAEEQLLRTLYQIEGVRR